MMRSKALDQNVETDCVDVAQEKLKSLGAVLYEKLPLELPKSTPDLAWYMVRSLDDQEYEVSRINTSEQYEKMLGKGNGQSLIRIPKKNEAILLYTLNQRECFGNVIDLSHYR